MLSTSRFVVPSLALALAASCAATTTPSSDGAHEAAWRAKLIDPLTAPTAFETPLIYTGLNAMAMHHEFPSDSVFQGGDANIYALQARYAVSDQLAIIATKDGFIDLNPDNPGVPDDEGFADIAAGFKYAIIDDLDEGLIVTPGLIFETTSGDKEVFQGNGDGLLRPFVSVGKDLGEVNLVGFFGYSQPLDGGEESSSYDYHLHASYEAGHGFFPLVELNGITYTSGGNGPFTGFEGTELINLGSKDVAGNSLITGAIGTRYAVGDNVLIGLGYEMPLTSREDIFDSRWTLDAILFL